MHSFLLHQFWDQVQVNWAAYLYQFLPRTWYRTCSQTVVPLPYVGHIVTVTCRFLTH